MLHLLYEKCNFMAPKSALHAAILIAPWPQPQGWHHRSVMKFIIIIPPPFWLPIFHAMLKIKRKPFFFFWSTVKWMPIFLWWEEHLKYKDFFLYGCYCEKLWVKCILAWYTLTCFNVCFHKAHIDITHWGQDRMEYKLQTKCLGKVRKFFN